jgi:demethylmenaquinone methyltransferase/2-methoxy-6-polyprenyl-1,4-benzoquinol methylase
MVEGKAKYIHSMFTDLCERYDRTSSTIALKRDRFWRDFAASLVDGDGERVLDVCCGTGELTVRLLKRTKTNVIAVDFCAPMVKLAEKKYGNRKGVKFGVADIELLPFPDETFTCVTVAFALRNVSDISRSILEMSRVLKKGGKLLILDLGKPPSTLFREAYYLYLYNIAPKIGRFLAGEASYAYKYLPHSLTNFPAQEGIKRELDRIGFKDVEVHDLTRGIAAVHVGIKP